MNTQQAKHISITEYLARLGYLPVKEGPNGTWYHSMLAESGDTTPSFQVSADGHAFHDWSTGISGSIIDLAMHIIGMQNISAALAHIETTVGRLCSATPSSTNTSFSLYQQKNHTTIVSVSELTSSALLAYVRSRGIPVGIARAYCSEVRYRISSSGKEYYSMGWPNNSGGWELRNSFSKLATAPKDVSVVNDLCDCTMLVFEGAFDFLAAVTLNWFRPAEMNAIVLNSTALLSRALPILQQANRVICLLDNDDSGMKATAHILQACTQADDYSHLYAGFKDLNDYLMNNLTINKGAHEQH